MLQRMKKISAMLLAATLTIGSLGVMNVSAAPNTTQISYEFYLGSADYTIRRVKTDASPVYMKCSYISLSGKGYRAFVYGSNYLDDALVLCSSGTYHFYSGDERLMANTIKSKGLQMACVKATQLTTATSTYTARGLWSSDS